MLGWLQNQENNRNMFVFLLMTETDSSWAYRTIEFGIQTETTQIAFLVSLIMCHCVCVCVFVSSESVGVSQAEALKEENDSLRCQLDAYRNEVDLLKQEQGKNQPISCEEDGTHSQQLSFLQQALQGMQKVMKHLMMLCVE